jgi:hypothetical protein
MGLASIHVVIYSTSRMGGRQALYIRSKIYLRHGSVLFRGSFPSRRTYYSGQPSSPWAYGSELYPE